MSSIWNFMGIATNVASLHYALCQSVNVFLADFNIVLNSIHENKNDFNRNIKDVSVRRSNKKRAELNTTEYLIDAIDIQMTSSR